MLPISAKKLAVRIINRIKVDFLCLLTLVSPRLNTQILFLVNTGKPANLDPPRSFLEKISWLKLYRYAGDPLVIQCADKLAVRSYVREQGLGYLLNELIGVYRTPEEIPWDKLPDAFVLKWNFGSGYNCVISSKGEINAAQVARQLKRWGRKKFWLIYSELQYKTEDRCILCERFLDTPPGQELLDYKFYCFHGVPRAILVIDRSGTEKRGTFMTPRWEFISDIPGKYAPFQPPRPLCLAQMAAAAAKLSKPFPFVRIDFYEWQGQAVFGEMTFTPRAGITTSETLLDGKEMGEYIFL